MKFLCQHCDAMLLTMVFFGGSNEGVRCPRWCKQVDVGEGLAIHTNTPMTRSMDLVFTTGVCVWESDFRTPLHAVLSTEPSLLILIVRNGIRILWPWTQITRGHGRFQRAATVIVCLAHPTPLCDSTPVPCCHLPGGLRAHICRRSYPWSRSKVA